MRGFWTDTVKPYFFKDLCYAEGWHDFAFGKVSVQWERKEDFIVLKVENDKNAEGKIKTPENYVFEDGTNEKPLVTGMYIMKQNKRGVRRW